MLGNCLCGRVQFEISGEARSVVACHCEQCRKSSGHYVAATRVADAKLSITGAENITWFDSSTDARRGFCMTCGSQLFWKRTGSDHTSVHAGSLETPTRLKLDRQIFTEDKADYYDLPILEGSAS